MNDNIILSFNMEILLNLFIYFYSFIYVLIIAIPFMIKHLITMLKYNVNYKFNIIQFKPLWNALFYFIVCLILIMNLNENNELVKENNKLHQTLTKYKIDSLNLLLHLELNELMCEPKK